MALQHKSVEEYRKEFLIIDEDFSKMLSRYNKLALQAPSSEWTPEFLNDFKIQYETLTKGILECIEKV